MFFIAMIFAFILADANTPAPMPMNMEQNIDCSALASEMQQFASQLTDANRRLFCNMFTNDQRNTAMDLAGQPDASGNMMSSDAAVQKVAKDNNMSSPAPTQPGGCPVK